MSTYFRITFFFILIVLFCSLFLMGFIPSVPLQLIRVILFGYKPLKMALQQLSFLDLGCLGDIPWKVFFILSIVFIETEAPEILFIGSYAEISSSSMELMANNSIGNELEGQRKFSIL